MIKLTISWYLNQKNNKQKHRPFEKDYYGALL